MNAPLEWYSIKGKYAHKVKAIVDELLKTPYATHKELSSRTGIPRSTVTRILNKLEKIGALEKSLIRLSGMNMNAGYRYNIDPKFVEFIESVTQHDKDVHDAKPRGFPSARSSSPTESPEQKNSRPREPVLSGQYTKPENFDELESWAKNGWFRVHGFQRKWVLRNYKLIDDEDKWLQVARLLNDELPPQPVRRVKIGRKGKGVSYIVKVYSPKFKVHFLLHFRSNSLIITLPKDESIYIPWDDFDEDIERELVREINSIASHAIKVYSEVFKQQVLAYDDGWVGKKRQLKPEVAYLDPDGIIRKVYEVEGATYIEGLGFWIDRSLKPAPEAEFESVETAAKFKKAIDALASGELNERMESIEEKVERVESRIEDVVTRAIEKAVTTAAEKLAETSYAGGITIQQQFTELWKRVAEIHEILQLVVAATFVEDGEVKRKLGEKLLERLGIGKGF